MGRFRGTNVWISIEDSSEEERTILGEDRGKGSVGVSGVCSEDDSRGAVICSVASVEGSVILGSSGKGSLCGPRCLMFVGEVNADNSDSSEGSRLLFDCGGSDALQFWRRRECRNASVFGECRSVNRWTECVDALQGSTAELLDNFACAKDNNIRIVVVKRIDGKYTQ